MDLAHPKDVALDAREVIHRRMRGAQILATPCVLKETFRNAQIATDPKTRADAHKALVGMKAWGVVAVELSDIQATIARFTANKLLDEGIIPVEEYNDALILAEAAVLGCQVLVSSDSHLLGADRARLALALQACGVNVVVVCSPREIVQVFAGW